jgi:hypothetical protein
MHPRQASTGVEQESDLGMGKKGDYPGSLIEDIYLGHSSLDRYPGFKLDG